MKTRVVGSWLIALLLGAGETAWTQGRYDTLNEAAFQKEFLYLVSHRMNRDSILTKNKWNEWIHHLRFPQATIQVETRNKQEIFAVRYPCSDSAEAGRLLARLRRLMVAAAGTKGFNIHFRDSALYFFDNNSLTTENHTLKIDPPGSPVPGNKGSTDWAAVLRIALRADLYYFPRPGFLQGKPDKPLAALLAQALGVDTMLMSFKNGTGVRDQINGEFVYESRISLPGFKARVVELQMTQPGNTRTRVFSANRLELTSELSGTDSSFMRNTEALLGRIQSALPPDYCYQPDPRGYNVYFRKLPWLKTEHVPCSILLQYYPAEGQPGIYRQVIVVYREMVEKKFK